MNTSYDWSQYNKLRNKLAIKIDKYNLKSKLNFFEQANYNHIRDIYALTLILISGKKGKGNVLDFGGNLIAHANLINKINKQDGIKLYSKILDNICFSDYIDRITFQKQIWQFNEMSSLVKTMYNNKLFHDTFPKKPVFNPTDVRFTKVLTKYSTEYNNSVFLQNLCDKLQMDKKDLLLYFDDLQKQHSEEDIIQLLETYEITKLDVQRLYRYIDKIKNYGTSETGDSGDNDASSEA